MGFFGAIAKGTWGGTKWTAGKAFRGGPIAQTTLGGIAGGAMGAYQDDSLSRTNRFEAIAKGAFLGAAGAGLVSGNMWAGKRIAKLTRDASIPGATKGFFGNFFKDPSNAFATVIKNTKEGKNLKELRKEFSSGEMPLAYDMGRFTSNGTDMGKIATGRISTMQAFMNSPAALLTGAAGVAQGAHAAGAVWGLGKIGAHKALWGATKSAIRNPGKTAATAGGIYGAYKVATFGTQSFESPTLNGEVQTNMNQYQAAMSEMQGVPDMKVATNTRNDIMSGMQQRTLGSRAHRAFQRSAERLPFGLHEGRHG